MSRLRRSGSGAEAGLWFRGPRTKSKAKSKAADKSVRATRTSAVHKERRILAFCGYAHRFPFPVTSAGSSAVAGYPEAATAVPVAVVAGSVPIAFAVAPEQPVTAAAIAVQAVFAASLPAADHRAAA